MKFLISLTLVLVYASSASAQGYVNFANRVPLTMVIPVFNPDPNNPTVRYSGNSPTNGGTRDWTGFTGVRGTNYTATLWAAPVETGLVPPLFQLLATTTFRSNLSPSTAGYWIPPLDGPTPVPFVTQPGTPILVQVRIWDSRGGIVNTWAEALADPTIPSGYCDTFTVTPTFSPAEEPATLFGLQSFNLTVVPEPAVVMVGLAGAGLLFAFRRSYCRNS